MSFVKIWIHLVFATKNRFPFLIKENKIQIIHHITDYSKSKEVYIDTINGGSEHLHCLISLGKEQTISNVTNLIKGESSFWINENKLFRTKFNWADRYFAVSAGESQLESIRRYINNQENHHKKRYFQEEYDEFIDKYGFQELG